MGATERRCKMMKMLCRRRHETTHNLASEFGVSKRTIQRDIEALSMSEPIYTLTGKYGGVYVVDGYFMDRSYMTEPELDVLRKIRDAAEADLSLLTEEERNCLSLLLLKYSGADAKP